MKNPSYTFTQAAAGRNRTCARALLLSQLLTTACAAQPATAPATAKQPATSAKQPALRRMAQAAKPADKPQPATGAPAPATATPAAPSAPGAPPGTIRLDFHGTNIDTVLQAYAMAFKWTVVKDPACTGDVTVIETDPMDKKRAFQVLQALLEVRGFVPVLDGSILKIMSVKRAVSSSTLVRVVTPGESTPAGMRGFVRAVIPLSSAEAPTLAKDLQPLLTEGASIIGTQGANALIITDTEENIEALRTIIASLDKGAGNTEWRIFHLKHVPAKQMVDIITDVFKQIAPRTPPAPMGPPGQPQPPPQPGAKPDVRGAVAAVADERSNSVVVVGSVDNLKRVEEIVAELDEKLNPHNETHVYEVKFADAGKLAQMVNDALVGGMGSGGGQSAQASFNPYGNPFERRAQGTQVSSFSAGGTKIVADTRTNKLIITADTDMMKTVEGLLEELDKPVEYATTTFTIKLKNSNADDMAYVLAQAFGTSSPQLLNPFYGGYYGGGQQGRGARQDRRIKRRQGDDSGRGARALGGGDEVASARTGFRPADDPTGKLLADASGRPPLPPGAEQLAQFYYDPYFSQRRNGSDATTGRNSSGKYVNLLQLRNNVLVTAERNTNSLIITTSPENERAVRELVSDLDVEVKQVLLEAIVAEVTLDKEHKFGINYLFKDLKNQIESTFPVLPPTGPIGVGDLGSGFRYTILHGNFQAVITAIQTDQKIRILSTPSIFTANNQQAEIDVTQSIPYLKGTTIGFGGETSTSVDFLDVGLILNVTPRITADGMVAVDVYQEDSNLVEFRDVGNKAVAPLTSQRVTDTSVTLRNGDTLVLGGLQQHSKLITKNKIPILGDIPLLGNLFRNTSRSQQHTELVVFLTPRVLNNADEARALSQRELKRVQKTVPEAGPMMTQPVQPEHDGAPEDDEPKK